MYEQYQQKMRSQKYFGLQPSRREAIPRMKESLRSLGGLLSGDSTTPRGVSEVPIIKWPKFGPYYLVVVVDV